MPPEDDPAVEVELEKCAECRGQGWVFDEELGALWPCPECEGEGMY